MSKKFYIWITVGICIFLLLIAGISAYLLYREKSKQTSHSTETIKASSSLPITTSIITTLPPTTTPSPPPQVAFNLLNETGQGLIANHIANTSSGWAWKSVIQSPHAQTDRDVGAASIAMGFLALWQTTHTSSYLQAATEAGDWLITVAQPSNGGYKWPDYYDNSDNIADDHYTSFDDGAPGISDILWQLGQATHNGTFSQAAIKGMQWEMSQGENVGTNQCPQVMCKWKWDDSGSVSYQIGMGEGVAGVVYAFEAFYERTGNPVYEEYAQAGAAFVETQISTNGAVSETENDTQYDTGFLSGASGDAYMFLDMYVHTHNTKYLQDATKILQWVKSQEITEQKGIAWPIMIDPVDGNDDDLATGIEEGNAGIGWVGLQAYKVTGDTSYLTMATKAGDWLLLTGIPTPNNGLAWEEDYSNPLIHSSLDNGAPGIGWFLHDLYLATGNQMYQNGALGAVNWLSETAHISNGEAYWYENQSTQKGETVYDFYAEPSWHWGNAGIAGFLAYMNGWNIDMPGEEPGL